MLVCEPNLETKDRRIINLCQHKSRYFVNFMSETTFGQRLKRAFGNAKYSIIAEKMGVSEATVKVYMAGRVPDAEKLLQINRLTNCSLHWLLKGEGPQFDYDLHEREVGIASLKILNKIKEIAKEQSHHVFARSEIMGNNGEVLTAELLIDFLLNVGMQEYNLIADDEWLMADYDRERAERFTFVREKQPDIEARFRQIIQDELAKAGVGAEPDSVKIEDADMILAPVIAHISGDEREVPLRKTG